MEKKIDSRNVKIALLQMDFNHPDIEKFEKCLKLLPDDIDFVCTAEHSFLFGFEKSGEFPTICKITIVQELQKLAVKYDVNLIVCGICEPVNKETSLSCLFLSRNGDIHWHTKNGKDDGVFETEFGKIGILICLEIENYEKRERCLKHSPKIVFNPSLIAVRSGNPNFKIARESISKKLEKASVDYNVCFVRCDHPYPVGLATSQIIVPDHTHYFSSHDSCVLFYSINLKTDENLQSKLSLKPPYTERSFSIDNVGNRYSVHSFSDISKPIKNAKIFDPMMLIASMTGSGKIEVYNFNNLQLRTSFIKKKNSKESTFLTSKKNGIISTFDYFPNVVLVNSWDMGRGCLVIEKELKEICKFQEFLIGNNFVSLDHDDTVLHFFSCKDMKLEYSSKFNIDGKIDKLYFDPDYSSNVIFTTLENIEILSWDRRKMKQPIWRIENDCELWKVRFCNSKPYYSDIQGSLFKIDGNIRKCLLKNYCGGISDFLSVGGSDMNFVVGKVEGKLSVYQVGNMKSNKIYDFPQVYKTREILFNSKNKIFTVGDEMLSVYNFRQNRVNKLLSEIFCVE